MSTDVSPRSYSQPFVGHPWQPRLRDRYPDGVQLTPYGYPDWIPYARLLVELPPPPRGWGWDEARVLGVQTANEVGRRTGDPLWTDDRTPVGWTWARLAMTHRAALVPIELHGAFRHRGGVATSGNDQRSRGLRDADGPGPRIEALAHLTEASLEAVERETGTALPPVYRDFLARAAGGRPSFPAVDPRAGFVVDQPFFGATVPGVDRIADQLTFFDHDVAAGWMPIGFVQGGLLVLRISGPETGSVWYLDDDDLRGTLTYSADQIARNLLDRLAPSFDDFWSGLRPVPAPLRELATRHAREGWAQVLHHRELGRSLPPERRA